MRTRTRAAAPSTDVTEQQEQRAYVPIIERAGLGLQDTIIRVTWMDRHATNGV